MNFADLQTVAGKLDDVFAAWGFGGGWAIDGCIGAVTRPHDDIDICILREDLSEWREIWPDAQWYKVVEGREVALPEGEMPDLASDLLHVRDGESFYELVLLETEGENWVYRRDPRIKMPVEEAFVAGVERLPFLNPAIALLFKSYRMRDKDMKDFTSVLPYLADFEKQWLLKALQVAYGEHIWLDALKGK